MRDLFAWSVPLGRVHGITVRLHWLFPFVAIGVILRAVYQEKVAGEWIDVAVLMGLLFGSVLLHEFGHCFGARLLGGDADEILIWPLGGLAAIEVPHTARANFLAALAGPIVNLLLCLFSALLLFLLSGEALRPPLNPLAFPFRDFPDGSVFLHQLDGAPVLVTNAGLILLARLFFVNWFLLLLNLLPGYPLDGGRMFQCILWPRTGLAQATRITCYVGFGVALVIGIISIAENEILAGFLAFFIAMTCQRQLIFLEMGGEESLFGYDFSQGYTSLEQREATPRRRRQNFFQRWLQRRAQRRMQREQETRESEERRMDELLEKVQREGLQALTDEERRFLTRVSARYRNRH